MLQRVAFASGNLRNEVRQIMYSSYQAKKIIEKLCNNKMNSIKLWNIFVAVFMNSENSETSDSHILLLILSDKIDLKRSNKYVALSNLSIYHTWKDIKMSYKNNEFKISRQTWDEIFELLDGSYLVKDIQYYFKYIIKKHKTLADNPPIKIYGNIIENRITFKIKTRLYLQLLMPEPKKLFWTLKIT